MPTQRLQKILARAGFGSRRQCEDLMLAGRVRLDGRPATELGTSADPETQTITCDGTPVRPEAERTFLLNKPRGVECTAGRTSRGRTRVIDILRGVSQRIFPIGRLDVDSEGLLLVTNNGELAQRLSHPSHGVAKTYEVVVRGRVGPETVEKLRGGIWLAEGRTAGARVRVLRAHQDSSRLEITLSEGRNREVRRILARVGHPVSHLRRTSIGRLQLGDLQPGEFRPATAEDLRRALQPTTRPAPAARRGPRSPGGEARGDTPAPRHRQGPPPAGGARKGPPAPRFRQGPLSAGPKSPRPRQGPPPAGGARKGPPAPHRKQKPTRGYQARKGPQGPRRKPRAK